jgi:hypothetical protein
MTIQKCPFCDSSVTARNVPSNFNQIVTCPRCGVYHITLEALEYISFAKLANDDKILFSGYLRNYSTEVSPIVIMSDQISDIDRIVAPYKRMSVLDKIDRLIRYVGDHSKFIEDKVEINCSNDFTAIFCKNTNEIQSLINYLIEQKVIAIARHTDIGEMITLGYSLTVEGWQKYEKLLEINPESKKVFIAMSFDKQYDDLFDKAILPACDSCGFHAIRVDKTQHNEKICDRIIAEIKQSRFVIADFTGQNNGVYYEAGYAQGIGLDVVRCCKKEEIDDNKLHFDIRQYKHVAWETIDDLRTQLIDFIEANIK